MEKCIFIGYPQGYKGWKFYNPETKKVVISEHADFDERFFMHQKRSVPHLPSPRPESLLETPSPPSVRLPETLDDSMDDLGDLQSSQLPVHGGGGSTASDLPPVRSQSPQTPPSTYLSLPPSSPSPPKPISLPDTPPAPAAPSRPQRIRRPRSEWMPASAKLHALQLRGKLLFLRFFGLFVLFCPFPWYLPNFSLFLST